MRPRPHWIGLGLIALAWFGSALAGRAEPRISEFLADNADGVRDEDGDASDFIELYNPDSAPVNLAGYALSDTPAEPQKWILPAITLQPGQHWVLWASGKNRTNPAAPLHTNFKLASEGGYLSLTAADGTTRLTVFDPYPAQFPDHSYGIWQPEVAQSLVISGAPARWIAPTSEIDGWREVAFDDSSWNAAATGIGYDRNLQGVDYNPLLGSGGDTNSAMFSRTTTCYVRVPFSLAVANALAGLQLRMKYDDGFVAYLNGRQVAARNAPANPDAVSGSTAIRDDLQAVVFEEIDLGAEIGALRAGPNVLAVHALNQSVNSSDLLVLPELQLRRIDLTAAPVTGYFAVPTPEVINGVAKNGLVGDTRFSVDRGIFSAPFSVAITSDTPQSEIRYTTDGSDPSGPAGAIYSEPIAVAQTTVLRAAAFRKGWHPSNIDTQTYVFPADVIRQPATPPGYPSTWGTTINVFGQTVAVRADYAMDQGVVNATEYAGLTEAGLRNSLPVVALTTDKNLLFATAGIYSNGRDSSDEVPISMELFGPGFAQDLQIDGGVRIHGGNAREHPKKPLRLYFRKSYGTDKLRYPLFPGSKVDSFDQLILRPGGHDGWAVPFGNDPFILAPHASYVRDQFLRKMETDMDRLSPRGRYVHLYLNGLYWGVYDLHERPNADYYSSHLGGEPEDWDVVHHPTFIGEDFTQVDGESLAWQQVLTLADAGIETDAQYQALAALLDIDDYIDSLIVRTWSADYDWCGPIYLKNNALEAPVEYFDNKNWYAGRRSRGLAGKFLLHAWDAEMSMGIHLMLNRGAAGTPSWLAYPPPQDLADLDCTRVGTQGAPTWPYAKLRSYPPFQRKFADHLQKHFFNDGMMTTAANLARLEALTAQLELPIVAESARWGDVNRNDPFNIALTRDGHWRPEVNWLRDTFIAGRNGLVLGQFRSIGLFPAVDAPVVVPFGGSLAPGTPVIMQNPNAGGGDIFYTLDGSEPTVIGLAGDRTFIADGAPCTWWVPSTSIGNSWRTPKGPSNAATWSDGTNGFGFDTAGGFQPHFTTSVDGAMRGVSNSIYLRIPFVVESQAQIDALSALTLELKYDDGFIAALNGAIVQRTNAPAAGESWQSAATTTHDNDSAKAFQAYNITAWRSNLLVGENVLAIQGLNRSLTSLDFLCTARLTAQGGGSYVPAPTAQAYDASHPPVLAATATVKARVRQGGVWSALSEASFIVGVPASAENLVLSEFHYHPSSPSALEVAAGFSDDREFEFIELLNVSNDTVELAGCRFTNGVAFDFSSGAVLRLPAGQRVIVARNQAALALRSQPGLQIAGSFADDSQLANSGERLRLEAADGSTIFDLTYGDNVPWPAAADGSGFTLVLMRPESHPVPGVAANWRASLDPGGTPGGLDTEGYGAWAVRHGFAPGLALLDHDGDGAVDLLEYVAGTDPLDPAEWPRLEWASNGLPSGAAADTGLALKFQRRRGADQAELTLEQAASMVGSWSPAAGSLEMDSLPDGIDEIVFHLDDPVTPQADRFFRLHVSLH